MINDENLRVLYSQAALLLFPSLHEGFGWPIAEAQACGFRLVTTNKPPMTSVGGDAAFYEDPQDTIAVARCVRRALRGHDVARAERVRQGQENATRFSTGRMVQRYLGINHNYSNERTQIITNDVC